VRLAIVVQEYPKANHTFVFEPVRWLVARGHEVGVLTRRAGHLRRSATFGETPVVRARVVTPAGECVALARAPLRAIRRVPAAWRACPRRRCVPRVLARALFPEIERADCVLTHFGLTGIQWLPVAAVARRPYAVFFHGKDATKQLRRWRRRFRALFRSGAGFIANCRFIRDRLVDGGAPAERVAIVPNGVDDEVAAAAAAAPPDLAAARILTIGRLIEKKGIDDSILAFRRAQAALCGEWRYEIVGSGRLRGALGALAEKEGVAHLVDFRGRLPRRDAIAAYSRASIFVLASKVSPAGDAEGTPNTIIEAATIGLPIVATRHAGIVEILPPEAAREGFLVEEGDVEGLAAAIARLARDPAARRAWGEACARFVRARHSAGAHVAALVAALESVAGVPR
jgi:glycosyltransferase involved in cell wall biosynthesis